MVAIDFRALSNLSLLYHHLNCSEHNKLAKFNSMPVRGWSYCTENRSKQYSSWLWLNWNCSFQRAYQVIDGTSSLSFVISSAWAYRFWKQCSVELANDFKAMIKVGNKDCILHGIIKILSPIISNKCHNFTPLLSSPRRIRSFSNIIV